MRIIVGVLCTSLWLLYAGQPLSAVNYGLAVRLRVQDSGGDPNDVTHRLELWTARFDVLSLWTLPTAGVLMLIDQSTLTARTLTFQRQSARKSSTLATNVPRA